MGIQIARGAKGRWRTGNLHFRLRTSHESDQLLATLADIADRLVEPDPGVDAERGAKFVSRPLRLPDGASFWIDAPDASPAHADRLVATIVEGLESAGIDGRLLGPIDPPDPRRGAQVVLSAVPQHAAPAEVLADGAAWVLALGSSEVFVRVGVTWVGLPADAMAEYVDFHHKAGRSYQILADDEREQRLLVVDHPGDDQLRFAQSGYPHVTRLRCGPVVTADVDAAYDEAIEEGRAIGEWAVWVAVQVHPRAPDGVAVRPPWAYGPSGLDATIGLTDHLLAPAPWQRVTPAQAVHLPAPHTNLRHDADHGELRVARLDDWLREPLTARWPDFQRVTRAFLGTALLTRDLVWERLHPDEAPGVDPATVPLSGQAQLHPSIGTGPLELLALAQHQPFSDDAARVSGVLRNWLEGFGPTCTHDPELVRRLVLALAEVDPELIDESEQDRHRELLFDWLLRDLTPSLLALTGLEADFVARLPPTNRPTKPIELVAPILDCVHELLRRHDPGAEPASNSNAAFRHARWLARRTARAASIVPGTGSEQPALVVETTLMHASWWDGPLPATATRQLWWAAGDAAGKLAFDEAYRRARTTEPRLEHLWLEAEMQHRIPGEPRPRFEWFCDRTAFTAAGRATMNASDPASAWDEAVAAARSATPWWDGLETGLSTALPADVVERSWQTGRRQLARTQPTARRVATIAAAAEPAARACDLAALAADRQDLGDALHTTVWDATDRLVDRLRQPP